MVHIPGDNYNYTTIYYVISDVLLLSADTIILVTRSRVWCVDFIRIVYIKLHIVTQLVVVVVVVVVNPMAATEWITAIDKRYF